MKRASTLMQAFTLVMAGVLFVMAFSAGRPGDRPEPPAMPTVDEQKDDPGAAARFEWLRLRDPATGEIPRDIRRKELEFASRLPSREQLAKGGHASGSLAISWSARGPFNVGGRTRALAVDVANESIILAGGVSGGMWRSTNAGTSWTKTSAYSALHSVTALAQDTRVGKRNIWYYGTGEYRGNSARGGGAYYYGDGIFKSTDNGVSWAQLPSTTLGTLNAFDEAFDFTWNLATDPSSIQDEVYAATVGGIMRSTNGGTLWTYSLGSLTNNHSAYADVAVTPGGVVYAALSEMTITGGTGSQVHGIYRSADGVLWTEITPATFPSSYDRIVLAIAPSDPDIAYFLVANANGTDGVDQVNGVQFWKYDYVSGDGSGAGGTWENRGMNLPNEAGLDGNAQFDTQNSYNMLVRVKPDDPNFVILGGTNLYVAADGFATGDQWRRIGGYVTPDTYEQYAGHHADQHAGVFLSDNVAFLSGSDGGVSRMDDVTQANAAWNPLSSGYFTTQFYTIAMDHATGGNNQLIGGMQDNGVWYTSSSSVSTPWVLQLTGDGAACAIADGRTSYYMSTQNGAVYRIMLNASGVWQDFTRIDPTGGTGYLFINPFILDPSDQKVVYMPGGSSLWRNSDVTAIPLWSVSPSTATSKKSLNWTDLTAAGASGTTITALAASKSSPSFRLYYGTSDGRVFRLDNANTATASSVPTDVWTGKGFPADAFVSGLAVDRANGDQAMVVFSNYGVVSVFFTTNGGSTWSNVEGNLAGISGPSCRTAQILPFGGTTTYLLGTSTGLYSTTVLDGSSTVWVQEGSSVIGNVVVGALDTRTVDGRVVVGTHGAGAFSGVISATGVEAKAFPTRVALHQNYPNPFNPSTTIRYSLPHSSVVRLTVFSTTGEQVAVLQDRVQEAGDHEVQFDASGLASGVYLYRLHVHSTDVASPSGAGGGGEEFVESRKLVLLR